MQVSWGAASSYFQPLRVLQVFGKCCYAVASLTPSANAGGLLKEAVDDLEWPGGSVVVKLTRDPAAIGMVARGTGSLEVRLLTIAGDCFCICSSLLLCAFSHCMNVVLSSAGHLDLCGQYLCWVLQPLLQNGADSHYCIPRIIHDVHPELPASSCTSNLLTCHGMQLQLPANTQQCLPEYVHPELFACRCTSTLLTCQASSWTTEYTAEQAQNVWAGWNCVGGTRSEVPRCDETPSRTVHS
jgi:hypothetical protein